MDDYPDYRSTSYQSSHYHSVNNPSLSENPMIKAHEDVGPYNSSLRLSQCSTKPFHLKIARATVELYALKNEICDWNLVDKGVVYLTRAADCYSLVLFTEDHSMVLWQHTIDEDVSYKMDKLYFHIFYVDDNIFGLNFADLAEAEMMYNAMNRL